MKKTKGILGVILSLVLVLTLTTVPVSADTLSDGLDFTSSTVNTSGDGYTWDKDSLTLTVTGLTINTTDKYGIQLPDGAKIELQGDLNVTTNYSWNYTTDLSSAIYSSGEISIEGDGDVNLNSTGNGIEVEGALNINMSQDLAVNAYAYAINCEEDCYIENISNLDITTVNNQGIQSSGEVTIASAKDIDIDSGYSAILADAITIACNDVKLTNASGSAISSRGEINISVVEDVEITSEATGITGYAIDIKCDNLKVEAGSDAIVSNENLKINTTGNIDLTTEASRDYYAGLYLNETKDENGYISIICGGDFNINAENASGIYLEPEDAGISTITFNVEGDTIISGTVALYLDASNYNNASTTFVNNGGAIYLTGTDNSIVYNKTNDKTYDLTLQGSGEFQIQGSIEVNELTVEDMLTVYINSSMDVEKLSIEGTATMYTKKEVLSANTLTVGSSATLNAFTLYATSYEVYGALYTGQIVGNTLSIYDGANVILDYSVFDDIEDCSLFEFPLLLSGTDEFMPTITLGDHILLYTPTTPAAPVVTSQDGELDVVSYLLTVTNDGKELTYSDDETHNAAMYIVFGAGYSIDLTVTGEGSVTPDTSQIIEGEDVTYTFTPDEGYEVSEVIVDGISVEVTSTYIFEEVVEDHTLEVVFSEIVVEDNTDTNTDANMDKDTDANIDKDTDVDLDTDTNVNIDTNVDTEIEDSVDTFDTGNTSGYVTLSLFSLLMMAYCIRRKQIE